MRYLVLFIFALAATIFLSTFLIECSRPETNPSQELEGPGFDLAKMESFQPILPPDQAPDQWLLAHLDVETTGLQPGYHEMIDLGLMMTTLDGKVVDSFFVKIQPNHPERLSPKAKEINAFDPDIWSQQGAIPPNAAVERLIQFHERAAMGKQVMLVAYNSHFDAAFLNHLFAEAGHTWRELYYYFILDIPSMGWGLGFRSLRSQELMALYDIEPETTVPEMHTGLSGVRKNVEIYQALLAFQDSVRGQE